MEKDWVDFFRFCIEKLNIGSGWFLADHALDYLKSDSAKDAFEGVDASSTDHLLESLTKVLEHVRDNYHSLPNYYQHAEKKVDVDKSLRFCCQALYDVFMDALYGYRLVKDAMFMALSARGVKFGSFDNFEEKMVGFYADRAMIDLDENLSFEDKIDKKIDIEKELNELRNGMFSFVVTDSVLSDRINQVVETALSPNIDTVTRQLLVSALTVSCMEFFNYAKLQALFHIYNDAVDRVVKIKAFIGIMLCLQYVPSFYVDQVELLLKKTCQKDGEFMNMVLNVCKVELHARDLNAGKDAFGKSLLSSLLQKTKDMLKQDSDDDFYDEDSDDGDEMGNSLMKEIFDMMEGGTDIYFNQFKNKKNLAFFHSMYNWFMPFSTDSIPYLSFLKKIGEKYKEIAASFVNNGSLCDNDQYSFVSFLAKTKFDLSRDLDQIKQHLSSLQEANKDKLGDEYASLDRVLKCVVEDDNNEKLSPKDVFRKIIYYIHDLSRFYDLSPMRSHFVNPFEEDDMGCIPLPLTSGMFEDACYQKYRLRMARYCLKEEHSSYIPDLLGEDYPQTAECHFMLAYAYHSLYEDDCVGSEEALPHAEWLMKNEPHNFLLCSQMAKVYYDNGLYDKVENCWKKALAIAEVEGNEDNLLEAKEMLANFYIERCRYEDANKLYYELYYKQPDKTGHLVFLVTALLLGHPGEIAMVKRALNLLRSFAQNQEEDPISRLFHDQEAIDEGNLAKSFSRFMGSMSEYMQQDHSMDGKFRFLEGICMWILMKNAEHSEEEYTLETVVNHMFEEYHDKAFYHYPHSIIGSYITAFDEDFTGLLNSFGITDADIAIVNELMRNRYDETQRETKKMLDEIKNGKFK